MSATAHPPAEAPADAEPQPPKRQTSNNALTVPLPGSAEASSEVSADGDSATSSSVGAPPLASPGSDSGGIDGGAPSAGIPSSSGPPVSTSSAVDSSSNAPLEPRLIDDIVETVCSCFSQQPDDAVHLQAIKVLLSATISTSCEVHLTSLLKVVQTCVNIHLYSKNMVNQVTAKASLTQIVNYAFQKMERYAAALAVVAPSDSNAKQHAAHHHVVAAAVGGESATAAKQALEAASKRRDSVASHSNLDDEGFEEPSADAGASSQSAGDAPGKFLIRIFQKTAGMVGSKGRGFKMKSVNLM
jgi:hypothetical protein